MTRNVEEEQKSVGGRAAAASMPAIERLEYGLPRALEDVTPHPGAALPAFPALHAVAPGSPEVPRSHGLQSATGSAGNTQAQSGEALLEQDGVEGKWARVAAELESRLASETAQARQAIAAAREEGRREAQQATAAAFDNERQTGQARILATVEAFRGEQQQYFKSVEREVVRLALAIAARVLHREAQMDPLFLAGAVHVALEKLADTSGVVLRVAPGQVLVWQEMFRLSGDRAAQPEIQGDMSLAAGECVLETRLGTIEVGVRAQLEEIEKGFFDLLDQRPAATAATARRAG